MTINGRLVRFKKSEIPGFFTPYFWDWVDAWMIWNEKHLLPLAIGWYEHPNSFVTVIRSFDAAYNAWRAKRNADLGR